MKKIVAHVLAGSMALASLGGLAPVVFAQSPGPDGGAAGCHGPGAHEGRGGSHHGRGRHHAEGRPSAEQIGRFVEHRAAMLTAILDLDAGQATEVRRLLDAAAVEHRALMEQPRSDARRTAMQALHERTKTQIRALLNPVQRARMDRVEAVRAAGGERGGHGRHGGPGGHGEAHDDDARGPATR